MFDVTIVLFLSLISEYVQKKQIGMLEAFMINSILMIFCWLEAMLTYRQNELYENSLDSLAI